MRLTFVTTACAAVFAMTTITVIGQAPTAPAPPASLVEEVQRMYTTIQNNIVAAAQQFPEDKYTWTPAVPAQPDNATVRSWASLVAHMTDDANNNCWTLAGLAAAPASVERGTPAPNAKPKADLVAGVAVMVMMGLLAGTLPAVAAMRLRITDALRRQG